MDNGITEKAFQAATDHLPAIMEKLGNGDLLYLYARFKQATVGPCRSPKPGVFDYQSRKKWYAWKELGNMPGEQAKNEYVAKMKHCDPQWNGITEKKSISGRCVSRLMDELNDDTDPDENVLFRICKDGDLNKLEQFCESNFDVRDSEERTLLHWACDRGLGHIAGFLLEKKCNVNAVDCELLTPLHYASSCGYKDIVEMLLQNGADPTLSDETGDTPLDCAESQCIRDLLNSTEK